MTKRVLITYYERRELERLLKEGKSYKYIGPFLRRHPKALQAEVKRRGFVRENYNADLAQRISEEVEKKRKSKISNSLLEKEKEKVLRLYTDGYPLCHIAAEIGCSPASIRRFVKREKLPPRILKNGQKSSSSLWDRLISLEQQMQIVLDFMLKKKENNGKDKEI